MEIKKGVLSRGGRKKSWKLGKWGETKVNTGKKGKEFLEPFLKTFFDFKKMWVGSQEKYRVGHDIGSGRRHLQNFRSLAHLAFLYRF